MRNRKCTKKRRQLGNKNKCLGRDKFRDPCPPPTPTPTNKNNNNDKLFCWWTSSIFCLFTENENVVALILSRNLGLHGWQSACFVVPSTLPTVAFFRLQADEAEFLAATAMHVLTSSHMLNQHAARYARADRGASNYSNNYLPETIL